MSQVGAARESRRPQPRALLPRRSVGVDHTTNAHRLVRGLALGSSIPSPPREYFIKTQGWSVARTEPFSFPSSLTTFALFDFPPLQDVRRGGPALREKEVDPLFRGGDGHHLLRRAERVRPGPG